MSAYPRRDINETLALLGPYNERTASDHRCGVRAGERCRTHEKVGKRHSRNGVMRPFFSTASPNSISTLLA
jgi:hypothetical protein